MKELILVTGADGQLGSEIQEISKLFTKYQFIFTNQSSLDITDFEKIEAFFENKNIQYIINCAAYTQVDKAAEEPLIPTKVNDIAVANLVRIAEKKNIKIVHISTDYVFDGKSYLPLKEDDIANPIGVYGATKRAGELHLLNSTADFVIIRTSWLYSNYKHNFVKTIQRLASEKETLSIIVDQIGSPTYAADLAKAIFVILPQLNTSNKGIYHFSNEGVASWYDFAKEIVSLSKISCKIVPIETKDYKTLAARPHYSVMNKAKIKTVFGIEICHWKEALQACLSKNG